jgi:y4mF family transcriptional regulator
MPATPIAPPIVALTSPAQIGPSVKAARARLGWSQHTTATRSGVGYRFYRELEEGKATARFDKVFRVLKTLSLALMLTPAGYRPPGVR